MANLKERFDFDSEQNILSQFLDEQKILKKMVLDYMDKVASTTITNFNDTIGNISYEYLSKIRNCLIKNENNIETIHTLIDLLGNSNLLEYKNKYYNIISSILENNCYINTVFYNLIKYSKLDFSSPSVSDIVNHIENKNDLKDTTISQEVFIPEKTSTELPKELNNTQSENKKIEPSSSESDTDLKENTLIISEINQCVILPFTKKELDTILAENKHYNSYEQIIQYIYTIPLSNYKYSSLARFNEAYSLVKNRVHGSIKDAFNLGLELFFKYNLNPAVITACKNIDELDIYLSCLDDNELDNFKCFDIIYEILPTVIK